MIPERWAINVSTDNEAKQVVGDFINKNTTLKNPLSDYKHSSYPYLVFPSNVSHIYNRVPEGYTEITFEKFKRWYVRNDVPQIINNYQIF